jgi:hypothetical protein
MCGEGQKAGVVDGHVAVVAGDDHLRLSMLMPLSRTQLSYRPRKSK